MFKGMTKISLYELFTLEENYKGARGHSLKLAKLRCTCDCWKHFCLDSGLNRRIMGLISTQLGPLALMFSQIG